MTDTTTEATYRWTRERYDRAVEAGVFGPDDRLELIEGQLLAMNPRGSRHAAIVDLPDTRLDVYRDPTPDGYRTVLIRRTGETIPPLARSSATIAVADLLP